MENLKEAAMHSVSIADADWRPGADFADRGHTKWPRLEGGSLRIRFA